MKNNQVYAVLNGKIKKGGGGGESVDAYTKTQTDNLLLNKVDKEDGKSLISNEDLEQITTNKENIAKKVDKEEGKGLFSGEYKDLNGKPSIPSKTSDLSNDSDFATNESVNKSVDGINRKLSGIKEGAEPTAATISGSNPTVTNSANAPLIYGKIKGYTLQDGEPTPDKPIDIQGLGDSGTIEVKTYGKNLCYKNNIKVEAISDDITINNIIGGRTLSFSHTKSRISGTLINNENIYNFSYIKEYDKRGNLLKETKGQYTTVPSESSKSYAFTLSLQENTNYLVINYGNYNNDSTINTLVSDIQIEYSVVSTPYKPYTETVATIPIDTIYEGDYLEVYADGSGKIVRESNLFYCKTIKSYDMTRDIALLQFETTNPSDTKRVLAKCNSFIQKLEYNFSYEHFYIEGNVINLFIRKDRFSTGLGNLQSEFTSYIQSNPIYFVYYLATPIETPLTAKQVEQFKKLYTFDNVTNFFCDGGEITARYYVNTDSGNTVGMLQEQAKENLEQIKKDLGGLKFSVSDGVLTITDGTNSWTLPAQ